VFRAPRAGAQGAGISLLLSAMLVWVPISSRAASVVLHWTAPGDDSMVGRASAYDLRYSVSPITSINFPLATAVGGVPLPSPAGSPEQFTVSGLSSGVPYYFAIRTRDKANNWSLISNVVLTAAKVTGVDPDAPGFGFSESRPNPARERVVFSYSMVRAAHVEVFVCDIAGRRVRALESGVLPPGRGELTWNLRSDTGARVPPGLYLVRANLDGTNFTRRVTVER